MTGALSRHGAVARHSEHLGGFRCIVRWRTAIAMRRTNLRIIRIDASARQRHRRIHRHGDEDRVEEKRHHAVPQHGAAHHRWSSPARRKPGRSCRRQRRNRENPRRQGCPQPGKSRSRVVVAGGLGIVEIMQIGIVEGHHGVQHQPAQRRADARQHQRHDLDAMLVCSARRTRRSQKNSMVARMISMTMTMPSSSLLARALEIGGVWPAIITRQRTRKTR